MHHETDEARVVVHHETDEARVVALPDPTGSAGVCAPRPGQAQTAPHTGEAAGSGASPGRDTDKPGHDDQAHGNRGPDHREVSRLPCPYVPGTSGRPPQHRPASESGDQSRPEYWMTGLAAWAGARGRDVHRKAARHLNSGERAHRPGRHSGRSGQPRSELVPVQLSRLPSIRRSGRRWRSNLV